MKFLDGLVLLLLLIEPCARRVSDAVSVYEEGRFPMGSQLSDAERLALSRCPCEKPSHCLPVALTLPEAAQSKREIFAFSVAPDDRWKHYDWEHLTTVAWNEDKQLLCHAHSRGVKVVIKHNFDEIDMICHPDARQDWIQVRLWTSPLL